MRKASELMISQFTVLEPDVLFHMNLAESL